MIQYLLNLLLLSLAQQDFLAEGNLLESAEKAGLKPAHGCRMGICDTCSCTKLQGSVKNLLTGEIDHANNTQIKLCVSGNFTRTHSTLNPKPHKNKSGGVIMNQSIYISPNSKSRYLSPEQTAEFGQKVEQIRREIMQSVGEKDAV